MALCCHSVGALLGFLTRWLLRPICTPLPLVAAAIAGASKRQTSMAFSAPSCMPCCKACISCCLKGCSRAAACALSVSSRLCSSAFSLAVCGGSAQPNSTLSANIGNTCLIIVISCLASLRLVYAPMAQYPVPESGIHAVSYLRQSTSRSARRWGRQARPKEFPTARTSLHHWIPHQCHSHR